MSDQGEVYHIMTRPLIYRLALGLVTCLCVSNVSGASAYAQDGCCGYRMVYKTIYDQQPVTAYRLQYETIVQEQDVTVSRPEWVTEIQQRRYTVAKPVTETSTREDRYTVLRPVWETETRCQQQVVRKPVTETAMQNRNYVTYDPVTTMQTQYVDQGHFVDQTVLLPGPVRNRLQWLGGACVVDPVTGSTVWHRGGLHWVPTQAPGTYQVQRQYVPQIVAQQVPQTTYVQKVVTQQEPVQVTRYVDEVINQPVQIQVCKWVQQEVVRPVTVTSQRIEYEERVEPIQVQVCRWGTETRKVQVPHTVAKWVAYTSTRLVPRTVALQVPLDPCSVPPAITTYYPPSTSGCTVQAVPPSVETRKVPTEAKRDEPKQPEERSTLRPPNGQDTPAANAPAAGAQPADPAKREAHLQPSASRGLVDVPVKSA